MLSPPSVAQRLQPLLAPPAVGEALQSALPPSVAAEVLEVLLASSAVGRVEVLEVLLAPAHPHCHSFTSTLSFSLSIYLFDSAGQ